MQKFLQVVLRQKTISCNHAQTQQQIANLHFILMNIICILLTHQNKNKCMDSAQPKVLVKETNNFTRRCLGTCGNAVAKLANKTRSHCSQEIIHLKLMQNNFCNCLLQCRARKFIILSNSMSTHKCKMGITECKITSGAKDANSDITNNNLF